MPQQQAPQDYYDTDPYAYYGYPEPSPDHSQRGQPPSFHAAMSRSESGRGLPLTAQGLANLQPGRRVGRSASDDDSRMPGLRLMHRGESQTSSNYESTIDDEATAMYNTNVFLTRSITSRGGDQVPDMDNPMMQRNRSRPQQTAVGQSIRPVRGRPTLDPLEVEEAGGHDHEESSLSPQAPQGSLIDRIKAAASAALESVNNAAGNRNSLSLSTSPAGPAATSRPGSVALRGFNFNPFSTAQTNTAESRPTSVARDSPQISPNMARPLSTATAAVRPELRFLEPEASGSGSGSHIGSYDHYDAPPVPPSNRWSIGGASRAPPLPPSRNTADARSRVQSLPANAAARNAMLSEPPRPPIPSSSSNRFNVGGNVSGSEREPVRRLQRTPTELFGNRDDDILEALAAFDESSEDDT